MTTSKLIDFNGTMSELFNQLNQLEGILHGESDCSLLGNGGYHDSDLMDMIWKTYTDLRNAIKLANLNTKHAMRYQNMEYKSNMKHYINVNTKAYTLMNDVKEAKHHKHRLSDPIPRHERGDQHSDNLIFTADINTIEHEHGKSINQTRDTMIWTDNTPSTYSVEPFSHGNSEDIIHVSSRVDLLPQVIDNDLGFVCQSHVTISTVPGKITFRECGIPTDSSGYCSMHKHFMSE